MADRPLWGGTPGLRAMLSADPATVGECGYPDLRATGAFCDHHPPPADATHITFGVAAARLFTRAWKLGRRSTAIGSGAGRPYGRHPIATGR